MTSQNLLLWNVRYLRYEYTKEKRLFVDEKKSEYRGGVIVEERGRGVIVEEE